MKAEGGGMFLPVDERKGGEGVEEVVKPMQEGWIFKSLFCAIPTSPKQTRSSVERSWDWSPGSGSIWTRSSGRFSREPAKHGSEKPIRGTFMAATRLPPAPLGTPRAGRTGRRLGHGQGAGWGDGHRRALWPGGRMLGCPVPEDKWRES